MGLDAWGVKMKPGISIELANWDTIEDLDETDILPRNNFFYNHAYSRIHQSFMKYILAETSIEFTGNPCCSLEIMCSASTILKEYISKNVQEFYSWNDIDTLDKRVLTKKEVTDLSEYLELLTKNGFVLWFSF